MKEMDPDGNGEVTLDEFQQWWSANITTVSGEAMASSAQEDIHELKAQLAEANEKLKHVESLNSTMHSPDPLAYVKSARSKLRKINSVRVTLRTVHSLSRGVFR